MTWTQSVLFHVHLFGSPGTLGIGAVRVAFFGFPVRANTACMCARLAVLFVIMSGAAAPAAAASTSGESEARVRRVERWAADEQPAATAGK